LPPLPRAKNPVTDRRANRFTSYALSCRLCHRPCPYGRVRLRIFQLSFFPLQRRSSKDSCNSPPGSMARFPNGHRTLLAAWWPRNLLLILAFDLLFHCLTLKHLLPSVTPASGFSGPIFLVLHIPTVKAISLSLWVAACWPPYCLPQPGHNSRRHFFISN